MGELGWEPTTFALLFAGERRVLSHAGAEQGSGRMLGAEGVGVPNSAAGRPWKRRLIQGLFA